MLNFGLPASAPFWGAQNNHFFALSLYTPLLTARLPASPRQNPIKNLIMSTLTTKKSSISSRVRTIIHEKLGVEESAIVDTASFSTDLGLDSLDVLEAFMEMEKAFNIKISD